MLDDTPNSYAYEDDQLFDTKIIDDNDNNNSNSRSSSQYIPYKNDSEMITCGDEESDNEMVTP